MSYQRLIKTLTQYGLHDSLVIWFKESLNNKTQKVLVNNTLSNPLTVFSEVPQGGVINDTSTEINIHSNINLFVVDEKIVLKSNSALQLCLNSIY